MKTTTTFKTTILCLSIFLSLQSAIAQVGINTDNSAPDNSAMLDVKSSNKGFLPPRITSVDSIANPTAGLMVYDNTYNCMSK